MKTFLLLLCSKMALSLYERLPLALELMARRCGMTPQAMNAIKARHDVPTALVAMRLAKALCRVGHLFHLTDASWQIEAEWLDGPSSTNVKHTRLQL